MARAGPSSSWSPQRRGLVRGNQVFCPRDLPAFPATTHPTSNKPFFSNLTQHTASPQTTKRIPCPNPVATGRRVGHPEPLRIRAGGDGTAFPRVEIWTWKGNRGERAPQPRVGARETERESRDRRERGSITAAIAVQGCDDPSGSGLHTYWQHAPSAPVGRAEDLVRRTK